MRAQRRVGARRGRGSRSGVKSGTRRGAGRPSKVAASWSAGVAGAHAGTRETGMPQAQRRRHVGADVCVRLGC